MCRRADFQRRRTALVIIILAISVFFTGCNGKLEAKQDVVVWDVRHKPVFPPGDFSRFVSTLESSGLVVIEGGPKDILDNGETPVTRGYIIAGPTKHFEDEEVKQIQEFVIKGGRLVIMVHIPPSNLKPLLNAFGIEVSQKPLKEGEVTATPVYNHVLTEGIDKIVLYGCFRVSNPIFRASGENGVGVAGYITYGKGEVLVIGDDALFINEYITSGDNLDLAQNIAEWLGLRSV